MLHPIRNFLLILFLIINSLQAYAAGFYWVGGTGKWSDFANHWATTTGGVIFHTTIPGPFDDVYFDANSFNSFQDTVYLDSTLIFCRDMDWSGATNFPVLRSTVGDLSVYGSLTLIPPMTFYLSAIRFLSNTAGHTITSAGHTLGLLEFNGTGTWQFLDSVSANQIILNNGHLFTGNNPVSLFSFNCYSNNSSVFYPGSSVMNVGNWYFTSDSAILFADSAAFYCNTFNGGHQKVYRDVEASNFTAESSVFRNVIIKNLGTLHGFNSGFQQVTIQGYGEIIGLSNLFNRVLFTDGGTILGNHTFDTLLFSKPGIIISLSDTQTISNYFYANGTCTEGLTVIRSFFPGNPAVIKKSNGFVTLDYVGLKDIGSAGGAVFAVNNGHASGNTSGWAINPGTVQNLYWVGGTGHWNDPSHWSLSSGGTPGNCIPGPNDNVIFNSVSFSNFNDSVFLDSVVSICRNMDWTGVWYSPVCICKSNTGELWVYGSLTLDHWMKLLVETISFESSSIGNTIFTAGKNLQQLYFTGSGSWMLGDSLSATTVMISNGSFNTNNMPVFTHAFLAGEGSTFGLQLGTSRIVADTWRMNTSSATILAVDAVLLIQNFTGAHNQVYGSVKMNYGVFEGSGYVVKNMECDTGFSIYDPGVYIEKAVIDGSAIIGASCLFDSLIFLNNNGFLEIADTLFINDYIQVNGTCGNYFTIKSLLSGVMAYISKPSGAIQSSFVFIRDISGIGGAAFSATNSMNGGNVAGWSISAQPSGDLFWVGGSGNWNDVSHWSAVSGGTGGNCIPGPDNNVFFDVNSFTGLQDTVLLTDAHVFCRNMDWSGTLMSPVFLEATSGTFLHIYGSLKLNSNLQFLLGSGSAGSELHFNADSLLHSIDCMGLPIGCNTFFDGSGSWILSGDFSAPFILLHAGSLNSGNFKITANIFILDNFVPLNLQLGSSFVDVLDWNNNSQNMILGAGSSIIRCQTFVSTGGFIYGQVMADNILADSCEFMQLFLPDSGYLMGNYLDIDRLFAGSNASILGNGDYIHYANLNGSAKIDGINLIDTLLINVGGSVLTLFDSLMITSAFWTNAQAGFPVSVRSNSGAVINAPPGIDFCLDYLLVENINATGGATFYAGDHSLNLGGNSGWIWTSCSPDTSNVWPGDANYDLVADNIDLLYIGLAYGYTGPTRTGASTSWVAQPGTDWQQQFATGYNLKHADCDGNGTVNASDTLAVSLNYGLTHPFKQPVVPQVSGFGPDLYFEIPSTSLVPGSVVDIPIKFGTSGNPVQHIYGIAFTVNYDPALLQPNETEIHVDNSWLGDSNNSIFLSRDFHTNGYIDLGFTRIDHQDVTGYGTLATLRFKVAANAGGYLNLGFSDVVVIDKHELPQPVSLINGSVYAGMYEHGTAQEYTVFPNPTGDNLHIQHLNGSEARYRLLDIAGNEVIPEKSFSGHAIMDVSGLTDGLYLLLLRSPGGVITRKISVISEGKW